MDANGSPAVTPALGEWVSGLALDDVPQDVVEHLKTCLLNSLGCGLFGAAQPWGVIAGDVAVAMSGGGTCSLFARAETVSPADAAMANGTAIHGFELDDAHVSSFASSRRRDGARGACRRGSTECIRGGLTGSTRSRLRSRASHRYLRGCLALDQRLSRHRHGRDVRCDCSRGEAPAPVSNPDRACPWDRRHAGVGPLFRPGRSDDQAFPCWPSVAKRNDGGLSCRAGLHGQSGRHGSAVRRLHEHDARAIRRRNNSGRSRQALGNRACRVEAVRVLRQFPHNRR